jgi:uncharacterized membrane protein
MNKLVRVLLLGAVAFGIVMALTAAPSSGGTRGQATGYGDDVLQQCQSGQVASDGCLQSLETQVAAPAASTSDDSGDTFLYVMYGLGALVIIGGVAYWFNKSDFGARFGRS